MGMFDDISVHKDVLRKFVGSDPNIVNYLNRVEGDLVGLQTKDFECLLDKYHVNEQGFLYEEKHDRGVDPEAPVAPTKPPGFGAWKSLRMELIRSFDTCTITACDAVDSDEEDIFINLKFIFIDGVVTSVSVEEFKSKSPEQRKKQMEEIREKMAASFAYSKTYRGKICRYTSRFLLRLSNRIRKLADKIQRIAFKM